MIGGVLRGQRSPRVFGHRGAAGAAPENTIEGFQVGVAAGADVLELDVHATRDGVVVVLHDERVDRTTDGVGLVRDLTFAEVGRLDASCRFQALPGHDAGVRGPLRIPSLDAVLEAFSTMPLNIEIKQLEPAIVAAVGAVLRRHGAEDRVLLAAEQDAIMRAIRAEMSGVKTSFSTGEVFECLGRLTDETYRPLGSALQVPASWEGAQVVSEELVARAHARGVEVHVWTVNDEDEMRALLRMGVDGVITDVPSVGRRVVDGA